MVDVDRKIESLEIILSLILSFSLVQSHFRLFQQFKKKKKRDPMKIIQVYIHRLDEYEETT